MEEVKSSDINTILAITLVIPPNNSNKNSDA